MSLEYRIKRILCDIIDVAFKESSKDDVERYKKFTLKIVPKELKGSNGCYHSREHLIEIYNPSVGSKHMARCCLHELSHHIDLCQHGTTGHQKPFYAVYKRLIYAALDMGILEKSDFYEKLSVDHAKVLKMLEGYIPHPIDYSPAQDGQIIRVYNGYSVKEFLKNSGYFWNNVEQVWEKEVEDIKTESENLQISGILDKEDTIKPYYKLQKQDMYIDAVIVIEATGKTYENREALKKNGFYYSKESKTWRKKIHSSEHDGKAIDIRRYTGENECPGVIYKIIGRK